MKIYNCHIHTFTVEHVPEDFLPFKLTKLFHRAWLREPVLAFLRVYDPFNKRDAAERYANLIAMSYNSSQKAIFEKVYQFYPSNSVFVVLPMDMEYMGAGKVPTSLHLQHEKLGELSKLAKYQDNIIRFMAIDPRRQQDQDLLTMVEDLVATHNFRGIKIYPPLGFFPSDKRLDPVYQYAIKKNLPVMAHCSRGGVHYQGRITDEMLTHPDTGEQLEKKELAEFTDYYTDPDNYQFVFQKFPDLRVCLAHMGGSSEWQDYFYNPGSDKKQNWLRKILDMIRSGKYPNLYTDISYTIFEEPDNIDLLKILMADERLKHRILFGSDFYMIEQEEVEEKRLSIKLRANLGEELFKLLAETNPKAYLGIP